VVIGGELAEEGLDLSEVSLVAIMDADKEGFLRSETALGQTIGRAARNDHAEVVLYGDALTPAMERAIAETRRRRELQERFNQAHGIVPRTIVKEIKPGIERFANAQELVRESRARTVLVLRARADRGAGRKRCTRRPHGSSSRKAAVLRDRIAALRKR